MIKLCWLTYTKIQFTMDIERISNLNPCIIEEKCIALLYLIFLILGAFVLLPYGFMH